MARYRQKIVEYIHRPSYQSMKPKALAKKLGVSKKRMEEFAGDLEEARLAGEIHIGVSGRVQPPKSKQAYVGIVRKIASGDAFVILHEPKPANFTDDVFVDRHDLKDAQNGDEVMLKLTKQRRANGQRCGYVVEVIERATNVFVGTYFEEDEAGWVQLDGKDHQDAIWVGDPGAKGAQEGDKVVVELLRFPSTRQVGEGVLTKVLGPRGTPGVDTQMIIHEFGLPVDFPEEVMESARLQAENFREDDLTGREDLTNMTIVTIDPATARDFDDAISLIKLENGHWELGVHIADVSHFVPVDSPIDREAELRGTSVYLPTMVIPMLPEILSNGLASLQENRVRYTVSAFIEYTPEGALVGTRFARSAIKVKRRFAYEEVLAFLESPTPPSEDDIPADLQTQLRDMHQLAMMLRRRRYEKGSLELDMPEVKLRLNPDGEVIGADQVVHDESHQVIEEFMLAANIAVATEFNDRGIPFMRRVHADPSVQKMKAFMEFANIMGLPIKQAQSRHDIQKLLKLVKGTPQEQSVNYALLRSLKQAEYSPQEMGHYALAEEQYCHFTSPIRRYPDLLIHRLAISLITSPNKISHLSVEELIRLGRHCSMTERRAERAERELTKLKLLAYMESRVGEKFEAIITGIDRYGFFCRGIEMPAEGLVHISTLSQHGHYDFDRAAMSLTSRGSGQTFQLGDRVTVEVAHVDLDRRSLNFNFVSKAKTSTNQSNQGKQLSGKKRKTTSSDRKRPKTSRSKNTRKKR